MNRCFGDYIVFVDESGDQSLETVDPQFPVFVLAFCIFEKSHYIEYVVPQILKLKFDFFGSDIPIFHEREIRKRTGDFAVLMDPATRAAFMGRLSSIMADAEYQVVASLIDKSIYRRYEEPANPYSIAAQFGLERVYYEMQERGQRGRRVPVVFESRGKKEDNGLRAAVDDVMRTTRICGMAQTLEFQCVSKKANLPGLQLADLIARPIANAYLHPEQRNRAWDVIKTKMRRNRTTGVIDGYGMKVYPKHAPVPLWKSRWLEP
ncbi:DUF3800 domain-containing protein [Bifidobacterium pseudolongum]|uniref:DUF3800 domain-containing protein n=1 Tax=Bifidobacterium pseudolongum TaxID=1694 RepID=UPI0022E5A828|nr:DUF3800 domain-containing protein [Bifidobacterium pseudolongum]